MASRRTVVVLAYHGILPKPSAVPNKHQRTRDDFEEDLYLIDRCGYDVLSFDDLVAAVKGEVPLQNDGVIITFDDSLMSQYNVAMPLLVGLDYKATFFACPGLMGTKDYFFAQDTIDDILSRMSPVTGEWLFDVESHGYNHVDLAKVEPWKLEEELKNARSAWDEMFKMRRVYSVDRDVVFAERRSPVLALPYGGDNPEEVQRAAAAHGYVVVRTAIGGVVHLSDFDRIPNLLDVPSYLIHENTDMEALLSRRSQWPEAAPYKKASK